MSKVLIEMTGAGRGQVTVDGVTLQEVRSVSFKFTPGESNIVTVELYAQPFKMEGDAEVHTVEIPVTPDASEV